MRQYSFIRPPSNVEVDPRYYGLVRQFVNRSKKKWKTVAFEGRTYAIPPERQIVVLITRRSG